MFLLVLFGLVSCLTVHSVVGLIPPTNVCYQQSVINNACLYGNLTVALLGKVLKPADCNSQIDVKMIEQAPVIYINSTNSTERFTVLIQDLGPQGLGPTYLQWMVTNVSINTLPDYQRIPPNNVISGYEKPLLMHGYPQPHLLQILVFRHWNTLRVPFGELWVTRKQNFQISTLFSNTSPNLRLCGPVASTQFWVRDDFGSSHAPSAPLPPGQPGTPVFIPVVPIVPAGPPSGTPGQIGFVPIGNAPGQPSGYFPQPQQQPPHPQQPSYGNFHKKNSAVISEPLRLLFIPLAVMVLAL